MITLVMAEDCELCVSHHVEWKINNFFDLPTEVDYVLSSPSFSLSDAKWFIKLYPNGETRHNLNGWVSLYLNKEISTREYRVGFKIGIKRNDGTELKAYEWKVTFKMINSGWGTNRFIERSVLKNLAVQNAGGWGWPSFLKISKQQETGEPPLDATLTIFCSVRIEDELMETSMTESGTQTLSPAVTTVEASSQTPSSDGIFNLSESLKDLYLNKRFSDVTIIVKGREYFVQRSILAASSPTFASMLHQEMAEKRSRTVNLDDCDPDTFGDFLLFLHTGNLDMVTPRNAVNLYEIADKFNVKILKKECVRNMVRDISESTEGACANSNVSEKVYFPFAY